MPRKKQPLVKLEMAINLVSLIGVAKMHIQGTPRPLPPGFAIFKAMVNDQCNLTLYLKPIAERTLQSAREIFGLPEFVDGLVCHWEIDQYKMEITQIARNGESLPVVPIFSI